MYATRHRASTTVPRMPDWLDQPDAHLDPVTAESYDRAHGGAFDPDLIGRTVDLLAELAGDGRAVEFAIGTGRIAIPLAIRGVPVAGMDLSEPMLDQLRAKPQAGTVDAVQGDMTNTRLGDDFSLAYLVFNTIQNLRSQEAQVACFQNAAAHLRPGGRFVIENGVPRLHALSPGERIKPFDVRPEHLGFDEYIDLVNQISVSHHYFFDGDQVRRSSPSFRYVWPSELDLMARLAGLELEARYADWSRAPFTDDSPSHVSVWRKPS